MKLGGQVGCVTRTNRFDFGEDPDLNLDVGKVCTRPSALLVLFIVIPYILYWQ